MALQTQSATELIRVDEPRPRVGRSPAMRLVLGLPYWLFTTALAIIFLYPLIWTAVASVQGRAGTSQPEGWASATMWHWRTTRPESGCTSATRCSSRC